MNKLILALIPAMCFAATKMRQDNVNEFEMNPPKPKVADQTSFSADFLFWRADANDVELANQESFNAAGTVVDKSLIELDGRWEPGLRFNGTHRFGDWDQWDVSATYTYFRGESEHVSLTGGDIGGTFYRQGWITFLGPIVTSAKGHWNVNLNVGDVEVARKYDVTEKISVRPHAGVRIAFIDFNYFANYTGLWVNPAEGLVTQNTSMDASSDYYGGGLRGGSQFTWSFCKNLALFADCSAALLYSHFNVEEKFFGASIDAGALAPLTENYSENMNGVRANFELLLGLKGSYSFQCDRYVMTFFAGYELSEWFRINELFKVVRSLDLVNADDLVGNATFSMDHVSNDIGFQGLTARIGLAF